MLEREVRLNFCYLLCAMKTLEIYLNAISLLFIAALSRGTRQRIGNKFFEGLLLPLQEEDHHYGDAANHSPCS